MTRYTKRPITINAFQLNQTNLEGIFPQWLSDAAQKSSETVGAFWGDKSSTIPQCYIRTLEGIMRADLNDWVIQGIKGEIYPCKPDIFEATYLEEGGVEAPKNEPGRPDINLSFSHVIEGLRDGERFARAGWNGKDMFIFLVPGSQFQVNREPLLSILGEGTEVNYRPHIDMKAVDGTIGVWLASQPDILASDWHVV